MSAKPLTASNMYHWELYLLENRIVWSLNHSQKSHYILKCFHIQIKIHQLFINKITVMKKFVLNLVFKCKNLVIFICYWIIRVLIHNIVDLRGVKLKSNVSSVQTTWLNRSKNTSTVNSKFQKIDFKLLRKLLKICNQNLELLYVH